MNYEVIVNNTVTSIIAIIGWAVALYQFNKQHAKNINLQEENLKKELQIKTAEESIELLADIRSELLNLISFINSFNMELVCIDNMGKVSDDWKNPVNKLRNVVDSFNDSSLNFFYYFESREVILNKFLYIKKEFYEKFIETSNISNDLVRFFIDSFLVELNQKSQIDKMDKVKLNYLTETLRNNVFDILGYLHDFNVELQNAFLSEMFGYIIPKREPQKPEIKVLAVEK